MSDYDDYIDRESKEFEYQQAKEGLDKNSAHWERWQAEKNQEAAAKNQRKIFTDALSAEGLSQAQFDQLVSQNPQEVQQDFEQGVREYISKVASRGRDSKGRYTKQQIQGTPGRSVQQRREQQAGPTTSELKDRANRGEQINEMDVIDALFPDPLF